MTPYGFSFDSSACQAACKDKNQLPVGVLWRRVYEVTGGGWTCAGETWTSDVFAYHLSISCNHCERPICVEVCPTTAMHRRDNGIVAIDREKCIGCQYCAWACPYDAPQYNRASGVMTKCDLCADHLAEGRPPACVAACPMRVLELREGEGMAANVRPLPDESLTRPALVITPHPAAGRSGALGNAEEVRRAVGSERSLVAFTLLTQMAVGATWWSSVVGPFTRAGMAVVTGLTLVGLLASLLHLGTPRNAWRALGNLRTSWLSREVLSATLFVASLFVVQVTGRALWLAQLTGVALVVCMVQVYRLRTVATWNRVRTTVSFVGMTVVLGLLLSGALTHGGLVWWLALAVSLDSAARARARFYQSRAPALT
ncbi:MAG: dimethyl sulfoxide reductase anchor subunit [Gemmatimonadaceae bacterium]|nr:dimethyl sulfoxide reductase anchor subunit [Gemmatimonadaceae bacterium]